MGKSEQVSIVSRWEEIARWLFPFNIPVEQRHICAMILAAYFDESSDSYCFSVSGYVAGYATWVDFDWRWRDVLRKWNIKYFKSSECETLVGEFLKYRTDPQHPRAPMAKEDKDTARRARTDFTDVICQLQNSLCGIGTVVIKNDFERIISESEKARFIFGCEPYFMGLQVCLTRMVTRLEKDNGPMVGKHYIKPIFDTHEEFSGRAKVLYDKFKGKNPNVAAVLLPLSYDDDLETTALQASDFLTYEVRKYLLGEDVEKRPPRISLERISPTIYAIDRLDYAHLVDILNRQR